MNLFTTCAAITAAFMAAVFAPTHASVPSGSLFLGGIAVDGFGVVLQPHSVNGSYEDIGIIAARLVGLELPVASKSHRLHSQELPTSDIFNPAKACAIVVVDGVSLNDVILTQEKVPISFLSRMFNGNEDNSLVLLDPTKHKSYQSVLRILNDQFSDNVLFVNEHISETKVSKIASEMKELETFASSLSSDKYAEILDGSIKILIFQVKSLHSTNGNISPEDLVDLDLGLKKITTLLNETYGGQISTLVALMGATYKPSLFARQLFEENPRAATEAMETEVFLLVLWSAIVFLVIFICIFLCVPWAGELDPILYSSLQKDEKED